MKYIFSFVILSLIGLLACQPKGTISEVVPTEVPDTLQLGQEIAMTTFATLSKVLQQAIADGGIINAVQFCNIEAMPLTDSLSKAHQVEIKRLSDRYRNPANRPTPEEAGIMQDYQNQLANGKNITPRIETINGQRVFFAPIKIQGLCLNCHGTKDQIKDYEKILALYPNDQAIGYQDGDLRGAWRIRFK